MEEVHHQLFHPHGICYTPQLINMATGNELIVSRLSLRESDPWITGPPNNVHFHLYQIYLYSAKNSSGPNRLTLHSAAAFFHMGLTALASSATELGFFSCSSCVWFFRSLTIPSPFFSGLCNLLTAFRSIYLFRSLTHKLQFPSKKY